MDMMFLKFLRFECVFEKFKSWPNLQQEEETKLRRFFCGDFAHAYAKAHTAAQVLYCRGEAGIIRHYSCSTIEDRECLDSDFEE